MVVDARRVRLLLQRIEDDVAFLRDRAALDREALRRDRERLAAVKYVFVTAIEGCIEVAQHACASEGWGPPGTNPDALRLLARHGVLPPELGDALARAVGFRNVLVHGYVDVDDGKVVAQLDRLDELEAFVRAVARFVSNHSSTRTPKRST
jgi:uncharacterized protein YutE (UPF0331/DUF86 family)